MNEHSASAVSSEAATITVFSVVTVRGEIDAERVACLEFAVSDRHGYVVVDLSAVTFMDANGFRVLIDAQRRLRWSGGDLRIRGASSVLRYALTDLGAADLLEVVGRT